MVAAIGAKNAVFRTHRAAYVHTTNIRNIMDRITIALIGISALIANILNIMDGNKIKNLEERLSVIEGKKEVCNGRN